MRRLLFILIILAFSVSLSFSQSGSVRYVAVDRLAIKASTGLFAQDVGTVRLGDPVTVVSESGRFTQIRSGNITGWVDTAKLSVRRVISASNAVTPAEVALAGKGFGREVEAEYRRSGPTSYSLVDEMERIEIPTAELQRFIVNGRLTGGQ